MLPSLLAAMHDRLTALVSASNQQNLPLLFAVAAVAVAAGPWLSNSSTTGMLLDRLDILVGTSRIAVTFSVS